MDKLKQARKFFDAMDKPLDQQNYKGGMTESKTEVSRGSAGRQSAEQQRKREREYKQEMRKFLENRPAEKPRYDYGIKKPPVKAVPYGEMRMPSEKQMVAEGRMDLANSKDVGRFNQQPMKYMSVEDMKRVKQSLSKIK